MLVRAELEDAADDAHTLSCSGRPADGDGNGSVLCDVGAVEVGETPASGPNFVVNATTDIGDGVCGAVPGQCTLREAVMAANSDPDATVITFDPSVFASAQTVMLSQGQMQITAATTITGPGRDLLTVDANGASRHFLIDDANAATSAAVSISDISLLNGAALAVSEKGGSIRSHEPLTLTSVVLQGNTAEMAGGAVLAYHGLLASDCIVSGNRARLGGGLRVEEGDTEITGCEFSLNTTQSFGAAFATRAQGTTLRIVDSLFVDNLAGSTSAGAILVQPGLGMAQFERIRVIDNGATTGGRGGGLDVRMNAGDFILIDSEISGNTLGGVGSGRFGGGLYLSMTDHTATITRSTFSGNSTTQEGGGLYLKAFGSGQIRIEDSTISGNSAGSFGGGVGGYARDAASSIEIVRSTITDNVADADNNGIGQGGGIALPYALPNGMFSVTGTVIAGNADSNPSSAPDLLLPAATPFDLTDSLIGDNRGSDLMEAPVGSPDADNNLIGGPTNGVIDPALGILSDNGGPSFTHRPVDGSPLIDHYAGCAGIDQIGQPRGLDGDGMFGDDCDIGAVEFTSSLFHDGFEDGPIVKRFEARQATIERDDVLDRLPINGRAQIVLRAPGASPEQSLVIVHARRVGDRVELQLNRLERGVWTQGAWRPMTGASARLRW